MSLGNLVTAHQPTRLQTALTEEKYHNCLPVFVRRTLFQRGYSDSEKECVPMSRKAVCADRRNCSVSRRHSVQRSVSRRHPVHRSVLWSRPVHRSVSRRHPVSPFCVTASSRSPFCVTASSCSSFCVTAPSCSTFCVTASSCSPYNCSGTVSSNVVVYGSRRQTSVSRLSWGQYTMIRALCTGEFKPKSYVDQRDKFEFLGLERLI